MIHYGAPAPPYGPAAWDVSALGRNLARPYGDDPASCAGQAVTVTPRDLHFANDGGKSNAWLGAATLFRCCDAVLLPATSGLT
jgi:hypothetical protein